MTANVRYHTPVAAAARALRVGEIVTVNGSRRTVIGAIAKGRLVVAIDLMTLGGYYIRTVDVASDATVWVHGLDSSYVGPAR